jgi:Zn-dependent protease
MGIFAVLLTASFLIHEVAHKVSAQRHGLWAEFRLTTWGMLLTFASIFLPFKFISPGAMMISGNPNPYALVKIALSGPVTNIIFSSAFSVTALTIAFGFPMYSVFSFPFFLAAYINAFIAVFNLIPFALLDGAKIYRWNKKIWAVAFVASVVLTIVTAYFIWPLLFGY